MSNHLRVEDKSVFKPMSHDTEMVFGSPRSPKPAHPDVHFVNEKTYNGVHSNTPKNNGNESDTEVTHPAQPLLEPDRQPPKPPLAGPEIDDLDDDHTRTTSSPAPYPGIDDGLLEPVDKHNDHGGDEDKKETEDGEQPTHDEGGTDDGKWWPSTDVADHPYDFGSGNGLDNRFGEDGRPISPFPVPPFDVNINTYQQKKNLAQGMMDLALLSANANQLRYVLESSANHPYFFPSITFISLSIILQIAVGVGLILNSRYNVHDKEEICKADRVNDMTVLGIFLITIVNVFITSFSVASPATSLAVSNVQQAG